MCVCVSGFDWWHNTTPNFYFVNIVFAKNDNKDYYYYYEMQTVLQMYFVLRGDTIPQSESLQNMIKQLKICNYQ